MTDLDDFDLFTPTAATPNVSTRKCVRHQWTPFVTGVSGTLAELAERARTDPTNAMCARCGKVRDEATVRRNRNNRARGGAFERSVAKKLGGRRTGPLGGRDDVVVGEFAAVQTKKDTSLSLRKARVYLDDLARTFPGKVPLVVHAEPGGDRNAVVILPLSTWVDLHGPQDEGETA